MKSKLLAALILLVPQFAFAQAGTVFEEYRQELTAQDFESSDPYTDNSGYSTTENMDHPLEAVGLKAAQDCDAPGSSSCEVTNTGERLVPVSALIPSLISGQADILQNKNVADYLRQNIDGKLPTRLITFELTEPGLAEGLAKAQQIAMNHQTNMLLADIHAALTASYMPGADTYVRAYFWCLQKKMAEGFSYIDSQNFCQGDRLTNSQKNGLLPSIQSNGFAFDTLPSHTAGSPAETIKLSEMFFNDEGTATTDPNTLKIMNSFTEYFGDVSYILELDGSSTIGAKRKVGKFKIEEPGIKPAKRYQERIATVMGVFRDLLEEYCQFQATNSTDSAAADPANWGKSFASEISASKSFEGLSYPGFTFNARILKLITNQLRTAFDKGDGTLDCSEFTSGITSNPEYKDVLTFLSQPLGNEKIVSRELYRTIIFLSRMIALGQFLSEALIAENVVDKLSSTVGESLTSDMKREAYKLIDRAIGTDDLRTALNEVGEQLRPYLTGAISRFEAQGNRARGSAKDLSSEN